MFTTTMGTKTLLKLTLLKLERNYHLITSIRPSISYWYAQIKFSYKFL